MEGVGQAIIYGFFCLLILGGVVGFCIYVSDVNTRPPAKPRYQYGEPGWGQVDDLRGPDGKPASEEEKQQVKEAIKRWDDPEVKRELYKSLRGGKP
jgi:hypothetical protein